MAWLLEPLASRHSYTALLERAHPPWKDELVHSAKLGSKLYTRETRESLVFVLYCGSATRKKNTVILYSRTQDKTGAP
jgi:hypothetical protein